MWLVISGSCPLAWSFKFLLQVDAWVGPCAWTYYVVFSQDWPQWKHNAPRSEIRSRLLTCLDFPGTVLVYTCCLGFIIYSVPFHSGSWFRGRRIWSPYLRAFSPTSITGFPLLGDPSPNSKMCWIPHAQKCMITQVKQNRQNINTYIYLTVLSFIKNLHVFSK